LRVPPPPGILRGLLRKARPVRTVIYARFSSQLQNNRSTADQIADCRARAAREGWPIVGVFADDAISGAAGIEEAARPQLARAMAMIEAGEADQLLAESTDRVARHQGDAFAIRERLDYAGARLFTLLDGVVDDITGTIKGLFDARFRKDLAERVKRGQRGAVAGGRSPAGLAYGYKRANRLDDRGELIRGLRAIDAEQAAIVLRIFEEYDRGQSPRAIAEGLNADGIKGPTGGDWTASTIAGDRKRGNGMLQNRLYAGELVVGRTSKRPDPRTRAARIRVNGEANWTVNGVPALRIIPPDLWERVQARRTSYATLPAQAARRPKHLLSGKAFCGICGGRVIVQGREQWGCGRSRSGAGCSNKTRIKAHLLEARVLDGLQSQMLNPDLVAIFVREFHRDFARRSAAAARSRDGLARRHAEAEAKVGRLVDAIADPRLGGIGEVAKALHKATAERDALAAQLADLDALAKSVIALHPGIADEYRRQVAALAAALEEGEARHQALPIIQGLIDRVTLTPRAAGRGVDIEVTGRLATILALATGAEPPAEMRVNSGAGSGNRTRITSLEG
jgi:site-specific DNA recombinase